MPDLDTPRLRMVSLSLELVQAALADKHLLSGTLQAQAPADWPGPDFAGLLQCEAQRLAHEPALGMWGGVIIHKADRLVIGDMGFKGLPDDHGALELGYSIVPAYRGRGLAPEMAQAVINWAFTQPGVERVVAECEQRNVASIRVLQKLGMQPTERVDEMLWWELRKA